MAVPVIVWTTHGENEDYHLSSWLISVRALLVHKQVVSKQRSLTTADEISF